MDIKEKTIEEEEETDEEEEEEEGDIVYDTINQLFGDFLKSARKNNSKRISSLNNDILNTSDKYGEIVYLHNEVYYVGKLKTLSITDMHSNDLKVLEIYLLSYNLKMFTPKLDKKVRDAYYDDSETYTTGTITHTSFNTNRLTYSLIDDLDKFTTLISFCEDYFKNINLEYMVYYNFITCVIHFNCKCNELLQQVNITMEYGMPERSVTDKWQKRTGIIPKKITFP